MAYRIVVLVLLLMHSVGCQGVRSLSPLALVNETQEENEIKAVMKLHSSKVEVYKEFTTLFTARGLYLAPDVREAAASWEAKSRLLNDEEREQLFRDMVEPGESRVDFIFGFYTPDDSQNRLEQNEADWRVQLRLPDGRFLRSSCLNAGAAEDRLYTRFLEWDLTWLRLYHFCFPISPNQAGFEGKGLRLVISGSSGSGEMAFGTHDPAAEKR